MRKGTACYVYFYAHDRTDDEPETGDDGNMTAKISKDGGALAACTNSIAEVDSSDAPGVYTVQLTATETDADSVLLAVTTTTTDVRIDPVVIYT